MSRLSKPLLVLACGVVVAVCAVIGGGGTEAPRKVRLQLVDATTGEKIGGMVRVFPAGAKKPVELPGLLDRLRGLKKNDTLIGWYVVPAAGVETTLPPQKYRVEALSGLETALANQEIDLTADAP